MGDLRRFAFLFLLVAAVAVSPVPAEAIAGPGGGGASTLQFTFATPAPGECVQAHTVAGTIDGALRFGTDVVAGQFSLSGSGTTSHSGSCQRGGGGDFFFSFTLGGTSVDGRSLACSGTGWFISFTPAPGVLGGSCSVDGGASQYFGMGGEHVETWSDDGTTTASTFRGALVQDVWNP